MEALPEIPTVEWPEPRDDGTILLSASTHASLLIVISTLSSYLQTQLERCGL